MGCLFVVVRLISRVIPVTSPVSFRQAKLCNLRHAHPSILMYKFIHAAAAAAAASAGRRRVVDHDRRDSGEEEMPLFFPLILLDQTDPSLHVPLFRLSPTR